MIELAACVGYRLSFRSARTYRLAVGFILVGWDVSWKPYERRKQLHSGAYYVTEYIIRRRLSIRPPRAAQRVTDCTVYCSAAGCRADVCGARTRQLADSDPQTPPDGDPDKQQQFATSLRIKVECHPPARLPTKRPTARRCLRKSRQLCWISRWMVWRMVEYNCDNHSPACCKTLLRMF